MADIVEVFSEVLEHDPRIEGCCNVIFRLRRTLGHSRPRSLPFAIEVEAIWEGADERWLLSWKDYFKGDAGE